MHLPFTQGALKPCVCPVPRFWELLGHPFLPFHAGTALIKPFLSALPFPTQRPINLPSPSHSFLCLHPCCGLSAAGHLLPQPTPTPFSQSSCSPGCLVLWPQETGSSTCSSQVELFPELPSSLPVTLHPFPAFLRSAQNPSFPEGRHSCGRQILFSPEPLTVILPVGWICRGRSALRGL